MTPDPSSRPTASVASSGQPWRTSWRADPGARVVADRHYNRQKIGSAQFVPPGRCLVLRAAGPALWVTSWPFAEFVQHRWPGAWVNSLFRREGGQLLASELIRAAVAATRAHWLDVPPLGMVSFVDPEKVASSNPGYCYLMAGFDRDGTTAGGLLAFRMPPESMPEPALAAGEQLSLLDIA